MGKAKILGRLRGPIASASEQSRNTRKYTEAFWDKQFNSDLFQEGIRNRVIFGELWHPDFDEEYGQVHAGNRSAVVLTGVQKKGLDYIGTFDILPTEAGKVLKNLYDVGCKLGISSRGYSDKDDVIFDENTDYDLITFDVVAFPGIKSARLSLVEEVAEGFRSKGYYEMKKRKAMENLGKLSSKNKDYKSFIIKAMEAKKKQIGENYDEDLQIEDITAMFPGMYGNDPGDMEDAMSNFIVEFDSKGVPYYKGGIVQYDSDEVQAEPGDKFFVDNIYWSDTQQAYVVIGDWYKL